MKFETVLVVVIGSILVGILGGFAARSIWIGIGLPVVLIVLGLMWLAVKPSAPVVTESPKEEEKKEDTTQQRQE